MIAGEQVMAARKLLGWTRDRLARRANVVTAYAALKAENGVLGPLVTDVQWQAMRDALDRPALSLRTRMRLG
jgi:predicted transcriptional regulator